ncbi:hypothetical protein D3C72_2300230 [compost metagenome]
MDKFMPHWRQIKDELNRLPVRHEEWGADVLEIYLLLPIYPLDHAAIFDEAECATDLVAAKIVACQLTFSAM